MNMRNEKENNTKIKYENIAMQLIIRRGSNLWPIRETCTFRLHCYALKNLNCRPIRVNNTFMLLELVAWQVNVYD